MRQPKESWVRALRDLPGCADDDLRWNEQLHRWEFVLRGADGVPRSQFFGDFRQPVDPVTGLYPFRDLDDDAMLEVLANLQKTFVGNPHDGAGSTQKEVLRRHRGNQAEGRRRYLKAGEAFADMVAERGYRLRGAARIVVPSVIGGGK